MKSRLIEDKLNGKIIHDLFFIKDVTWEFSKRILYPYLAAAFMIVCLSSFQIDRAFNPFGFILEMVNPKLDGPESKCVSRKTVSQSMAILNWWSRRESNPYLFNAIELSYR